MKKLIKILVIAFVFRLILSFIIWHPDVNNHVDWGIRFWEYGPAKFFAPETNVWSYTWPNQPPGTIYIFAAIRKLFEFVFNFFWWINVSVSIFPSGVITFFESNLYPALLKLPSILADLGIGYLIFRILSKNGNEKLGKLAAIVFLINPIIWYNSSVWGQTDSLVNFFALLAFVLLLERRLMVAILALSLSIYIKASLLIFIPIFLVLVIVQKHKALEVLTGVLLSLVIVLLLTLPFSNGNPLVWLYYLYRDKVFTQQLQVITANAFNIWAALTGIHEKPHTLLAGPFTYQFWGNSLFALAYIPILYLVYKRKDYKSVFWALSIASFSSFMLLTNMHERYLYPFFPVFTIIAATTPSLWPVYWTVSGINLLNLYNFWWVPRIKLLIDFMSFGGRLMPRILGLLNFGLFAYLYSHFLRHLLLKKVTFKK